MSREIVEIEADNLDGLAQADLPVPARFVFLAPARGGPRLSAIRRLLAPKGRVRFSGTVARTFADFDPGIAEAPLIALDTIVRSDAAGLERLLLSVLPHVDEIVLGVDDRSDEATRRMSEYYADCTYVFGAADVGMSELEWSENKIHFANARNLGRTRVHAPWTLVIDTDEYLAHAGDLRAQILARLDAEHLECCVASGGVQVKDDRQRLARTSLRWTSPTHNQLMSVTGISGPSDLRVVEDKSLRAAEENARRDAQRETGVEALVDEAARGNISALLHLAKHRAGCGDIDEAVKLVQDYRFRIEPHSILSGQRALAALTLAFRFYYEDNNEQSEVWALRTLLDGPCVAAFCLLGDLAEEQGDLVRARSWYEAACAITAEEKLDFSGVTNLRWGRLAGIQAALTDPATAPVIYFGKPPEEGAGATS